MDLGDQPGPRNHEALKARAAELQQEFFRIREGLGVLQQKLRAITATAKSEDGLVTATVGPRGQLIKLELDPRIYRRPDSKQLAATISKTVQRATAEAMEQVVAASAPYLPAEEVRAHLDSDFDGMRHRMDSELEFLGLERP